MNTLFDHLDVMLLVSFVLIGVVMLVDYLSYPKDDDDDDYAD